MPSIDLSFAPDGSLNLCQIASTYPLVICLYRAIGGSGPFEQEAERIECWQRCKPELAATGHRMVAISSETFFEQALWAGLLTDWLILSDPELQLADPLSLPVLTHELSCAYEPATLVTEGDRVGRYFPSAEADDAEQVTAWLRRRSTIGLAPTPGSPGR